MLTAARFVWANAILLLVTGCLAAPIVTIPKDSAKKDISMDVLRDKIRGGWAGQMVGVSYGANTEFRALGTTYSLPFKSEPIENAIMQDDLYVEMTFAKVMDDEGINAPSSAYGAMFRDAKYNLWHANAGALRNLNRGIVPPMSGNPKFNAHSDDIDFQIEADFIGLMCPGLPQTSNKLCDRVGHVMNYGDGVYGGMFVTGMYAAAYFESDVEKIVRAGLACLPEESEYAQIINDCLEAWKANPTNWEAAWETVNHKWDRMDLCPDGALMPLNIDAKINGAFIALGLLYGQGDMDKTLEVTTRCGQDSDCNPSSAAGVVGTIMGYKALPEHMRAAVESIRDKKFSFTVYSFDDICTSTEKRLMDAVKAAGGQLDETGTTLTVCTQTPKPARLEQWFPGKPVKLIPTSNAAWSFKGVWGVDQATSCTKSVTAGDEATLKFNGTGIVLCGFQSVSGGRADVYIDGKKHPLTLDAWIPANCYDVDMWREWNLAPGKHELRLVVRDDADARATNKEIILVRAVIYDKKH